MDVEFPDKQYLKIGEVARITSLNSSVLRFWETEFELLRPMKSHTGQRLYNKQNVQLILTIKQLLYNEKLTIAGAKSRLVRSERAGKEEKTETETSLERSQRIIEEICSELRSIRDSL
jgi:DNA-binding transcriptional MerR regulator